MSAGQKQVVATSGRLFALVLTKKHLRLKLFRLIPLAKVALQDVQYVRKWAGRDAFPSRRRRKKRPRSRIYRWPTRSYPDYAGSTFTLVTRQHHQIVVNMTLSMHYQVRVGVAEAKLNAAESKDS